MTPPVLVYVASPFSHSSARIRFNRRMAAIDFGAWLLARGEFPFVPIAFIPPLAEVHDLPLSDAPWRAFNEAFQSHCSALYVLCIPGWAESLGVSREHQFAKSLSQPVTLFEPVDNGYIALVTVDNDQSQT